MKIPFFFTFAGDLPLSLANRLIASIRKAMPSSYIFQQTDLTTPQIEGTDGAVRLERGEDFAEFFLKHLVELPKQWQNFVKIDYDCVVQKDLTHLFDGKWQVGLTKRDDTDPSLDPRVSIKQPYNNGVMFSHGKHTFFQEVYDSYMALIDRDGWMNAQDAVRAAVMRSKAKIKEFPCSLYNYTPVMPNEDLKDKFIVHYKGTRKHWGLDTGDMAKAMIEGGRIADMVHGWMVKNCR